MKPSMVKKLFFISFTLLGIYGITFAQPGTTESEKVPNDVIYLSQLEEWMTADNDTTYVINFWATWCRPCVKELPHFEKLHAELEGKKARVILVSLDFIEDYGSRFKPFLQKKKLNASVYLLDEPKYNDWIDKVSPEWSGALPGTLVCPPDRSKNTFYEQEFETYEDLEKIIHELN